MFEVAARVRNQARAQVARTKFLPAPIGGWNARDSVLEMPSTDAVILDNFFPYATDVQLRSGYSQWATGISGTVETLLPYNAIDGTRAMFAAAGANIYDVSASGAVGAAVQSGLSNARWQYVNFNATGTEVLYIVNGADAERYWNGTTWTTPTLTGISAGDAIGIQVHAERLWFILKSTLNVAYLPVKAVAGTVSTFNLGQIFKRGGYLMAMASWTLDAGYGMDDYAAFITSEGEVAIYRGTDPSSPATWSRVGVYQIGSPMGRRCFEKWAGDLLLVNRDGLLPFSKALMSSRVNTKSALTDKIQKAISTYTTTYASNFGWQILLFPTQNQLYLNIPIGGGLAYQAVMNTITGAWCRFTNWNASCWALWGDNAYFGTSGAVCKAWDTNADNATNIAFESLPGFNSFGTDQQKLFTMVKPVIKTNGNPGLLLGLNTDGDQTAPAGTPTFSGFTAGLWGVGKWGVAKWGSQGSIKRDWQGVSGIGIVGSLHMKGACMGVTLNHVGTDYSFITGGLM